MITTTIKVGVLLPRNKHVVITAWYYTKKKFITMSRLFLPHADRVLSCLVPSPSEMCIQGKASIPSPNEIFATLFITVNGSKVMYV